jgi:hypothetical protein
MKIAKEGHDILHTRMHKTRVQFVLALALMAAALASALLNTASSVAFGDSRNAVGTATQVAKPTPEETPVSQAGSTDAIVWVGLAIVAIILVPLAFTKTVWRRS